MIKKIALFAVVALMAVSASAQIKVNVGGGLLFPMGDFGDAAKTGFGANVGGKYMLNEKMAVGLNIGYFMMGEKVDGMKISIIPVSGSFTYYFGDGGLKPYASAELGYYTAKTKIDALDVDDSESDFGFAPVLGVEYALSDKLTLDANAKYHYINTEDEATKAFGINVGLVFAF